MAERGEPGDEPPMSSGCLPVHPPCPLTAIHVAASHEQHDVQEFIRVLFDALESDLKDLDSANQDLNGSDHAEALQRIYRGEWCDYVQCRTCRHTSSRAALFDDINLAIRRFDEAQTPISSLEAAISAFLEPETLDGDNAYFCERCAPPRDPASTTPTRSVHPRPVTLLDVACPWLFRAHFCRSDAAVIHMHGLCLPTCYNASCGTPQLPRLPSSDTAACPLRAAAHRSSRRSKGSGLCSCRPSCASVSSASTSTLPSCAASS